LLVSESDAVSVVFHGEDDRQAVFVFSRFPCPGLHRELAAVFAARTGPTGGLRTRASADNSFTVILRFLTFLDGLPGPTPMGLRQLRAGHVERFGQHRAKTVAVRGVVREVAELCRLLKHAPAGTLGEDLVELVHRPGHLLGGDRGQMGRPGYSDREFTAVMTAARADVAAIRDRIDAGERLLAAWRDTPDRVPAVDRGLAEALEEMDRDGRVRHIRRPDRNAPDVAARLEVARHLFLTSADLTPLIVLGVGLSGRNGETVKELPAAHRVLDGRAVAVTLIKRRRGKGSGLETVHWDTGGSTSRALHTAGGFYLLAHRLTARGRRFSGMGRLWCVWSPAHTRNRAAAAVKAAAGGHIDPFAVRLGAALGLSAWARRHGLVDDSDATLLLDLNRLKTTVEVRTTRAVGGHLPSARRTNTMDVSFRDYLRGDPHVRDWAEQVITTALVDAEQTVRTWRPRVWIAPAPVSGSPTVDRQDMGEVAAGFGIDPGVLAEVLAGQRDTVAAACLDIADSPFGPGRCQVSFLTCLRCPNAMVTDRHLPGLLTVLDALQTRLATMTVADWTAAYGLTWLTLTEAVLPRFTAEQQATARAALTAAGPHAAGPQAAGPRAVGLLELLELLDGPREPR
jgi:hypothetical protein